MIKLQNSVSLELHRLQSSWSVWVWVNSVMTIRLYPRTITIEPTDESDKDAYMMLKFDNFGFLKLTASEAEKIGAIIKN